MPCPLGTPFAHAYGRRCCGASTATAGQSGQSADCDGGYEDAAECCTAATAACDARDETVICVSQEVADGKE